MMMTTLPSWSVHLLFNTGPIVAWSYTVGVWGMYSMSHEFSWSSYLPTVLGRTSWLIASLATSIGVCQTAAAAVATTTAPRSTTFNDVVLVPWSTVVPLSALWTVGSILLCRWTRTHTVVGISKTPFYGPTHLQGQTVVITGANSGIGKETTLQLAAMGATVYMVCRSKSRAQQAIQDILHSQTQQQQQQQQHDENKHNHHHKIQTEQLKIVEMDLGDYASIHRAVERDLKGVTVHVLINNAGLMMGSKTLSKDGHELMMQANHLGHFLFTNLLVEGGQLQVLAAGVVKSSSISSSSSVMSSNDKDKSKNKTKNAARIINVTSSTYQLCQPLGGFDFEDIMCNTTRSYTLFGQYAQSKLANLLFTKEMARRYCNNCSSSALHVYAVHPGLVRTNVTSNMPMALQFLNQCFAYIVASMQKTPPQGAYSIVVCAAAPFLLKDGSATANAPYHQAPPLPPGNGSYIVNCQAQPILPIAASTEDAKRLWIVSEKLVGLR